MTALLDRMLSFVSKANCFYGFEKAVLDEHRKHRSYENAEIALALPLCSEIARWCQHKCKKVDRCQPEMLIQPMKTNDFLIFMGRLAPIGRTKFEAKRPWAGPL